MLSIEPGRGVSIVRGRFGIPIGGGGELAVVDGRIGFEGTAFRFPASTLDATGGLRIGEWMPDFDFQLRSRDLTEIDHLFQNFVGARGKPEPPSASAAAGEVDGHIATSWGDPDVTASSRPRTRATAACSSAASGAPPTCTTAPSCSTRCARTTASATVSLEGTARLPQGPAAAHRWT